MFKLPSSVACFTFHMGATRCVLLFGTHPGKPYSYLLFGGLRGNVVLPPYL